MLVERSPQLPMPQMDEFEQEIILCKAYPLKKEHLSTNQEGNRPWLLIAQMDGFEQEIIVFKVYLI